MFRPANIKADLKELKEKLNPVLKIVEALGGGLQQEFVENLVAECRKLVEPLFPLRSSEHEFVSALRDSGEIKPELLTNNREIIDKVKVHPGLLRRAAMSKKHSEVVPDVRICRAAEPNGNEECYTCRRAQERSVSQVALRRARLSMRMETKW